MTCSQGAEKLPNCKKQSLVYENVCLRCNLGAESKKELREVKDDTPTLYVGETSRSIFEKSREHWGAWRSGKEESHILKHQEADHGGDTSPKFIMRVVNYYKTALSRQVGEAVRIRRRGGEGSILNSRAEFNRCRIPRLTIEEVDEEQLEEQENKELKIAMEQLEKLEKEWGEERTREREKELRKARSRLAKIEKTVGSRNRKREQDNHKGAAKKRLKYDVEEETWGEEKFKSSSILLI